MLTNEVVIVFLRKTQVLLVADAFLFLLTCICLTAGVNLLTPSGHRQIRDVIATGTDVWA